MNKSESARVTMGTDIDWVLSMDSKTFNKLIKGNNGETEQELRAYFQKLKDAGTTSIFDKL